jgi:DUF3014 family protein
VADFSDLRLDRPDVPDVVPEARRRGVHVAAAALALLIVAAAGYLVWLRRPARSPASTAANPSAEARTYPLTVEAPAGIVVPPLDETDALVRQLVSELSKHPTVVAWLATDHLVRNFAVVTQNIADEGFPAKHLSSIKPSGAFAVVTDGGRTYIDPASYRRYDAYADAFSAIDARAAARVYAILKPRIGEALRDLGDPRGDADATVRRAIVELLATPVVDARIAVNRPNVMYAFEDPALESLSHAQRQLLRMGPRNTRLVQQKLREIAPLIGIDLTAGR